MVWVINKVEPILHGSVSTNTLHFLILTLETRLGACVSMSHSHHRIYGLTEFELRICRVPVCRRLYPLGLGTLSVQRFALTRALAKFFNVHLLFALVFTPSPKPS